MTSFTPNFSLPYPSGTDAPCDFPEQWCAFTDAMQAVLDTFQAAADRTSTVIPMAQFQLTEPFTITDSGVSNPISFDAVSVDTADWIDFDADNSTITVNRAGRVYLVGNVLIEITTNDNTLVQIGIGGAFYDNRLDPGAGRDVAGASFMTEAITTPTPYQLFVFEQLSADAVIIVDSAYFTAYWIADGAAP